MVQALAIPLGCLTELEGASLLLKTLYTLVARCAEVKLEATWKLPHCWLAFIILGHHIP